MRPTPIVIVALLGLVSGVATAQEPATPRRQIPPEIVTGLRLLEHEFGRALAQDCAPERCFSKGCVYVAHTVVEQPAKGGMPGLRLEPAPTGEARQVYLTSAECSFAHERSVRPRDARALATRLKAKVSRGWTQVEVRYERLQPLPDFLRESPEPPPEPDPEPPKPEPEPEPEPAPEPEAGAVPAPPAWDGPVARRELWLSLLPHFSWMIALLMLTFATLAVIWALRRLGRESPEEQALLAQMLASPGGGGAAVPGAAEGADPGPAGGTAEDAGAAARVAQQRAAWRRRLAATSATTTDPALEALVADLLRTGERGLLAKAVMLFPDEFPKAFPKGGALAAAEFAVAEHLKATSPDALPSDAVFFDKLERYALAASLTAHADTELIRTLHEDFGPSAVVDLLGVLPARSGALLFALSPGATQHEAVGLLSQRRLAELVEPLLRSNRIDPTEAEHLMGVLAALRAGEPLPAPPQRREVSDRGDEFGATAALSVLLPRLDPNTRAALVAAAAARGNGRLPTWVEGTLYGEMLLALDATSCNDLLLEVDVEQLAAWLKVQTPTAEAGLLGGAPNALRAALAGCPAPASPQAHHALAEGGRRALAAALRRRLLRSDVTFQALLV